jgi:hypothetical protein
LASCGGKVDPATQAYLNQAQAVVQADYTPVKSAYRLPENYGEVLFAASGKTASGEVMAILVRGSRTRVNTGSNDLGYDSQIPAAYQMWIVVDRASDRVSAYKVVRDGTNEPEYFTVPEDKLEAYKNQAIVAEDVFDSFAGGLVTAMPYEREYDEAEGVQVITGTSLIYTGATVMGTFSSQFVRNCFAAAARYYVNNK